MCETCEKYQEAMMAETAADHPYTASVVRRMWEQHCKTEHSR